MAKTLFRGLPATGGIKDVATRRVVDGIIENLRKANLAVSETGAVYAGPEQTDKTNTVLEQTGAGAKVALDFSGHKLRLRTLVGSGIVSVVQNGNTITIGFSVPTTRDFVAGDVALVKGTGGALAWVNIAACE
jgi:hypothetical protein